MAVAFLQAAADELFRVARGQPPDDQLDRVLVPAAEGHAGGDRPDIAVDPGVGEALLARALEHLLVEPLAADHLGREEGGRCPAEAGAHLVHDGRLRLRGQRPAAAGAVLPAELAVEQAQEVVGLRQRRDGGAPPGGADALLDRHRRCEAADHVDIGPFHDLHVLADVGRQALEVAPLALREQDVEGQGGLARPGDARQHDQLVVGQRNVDVLQVVLAGAADLDRRRRGPGGIGRVRFGDPGGRPVGRLQAAAAVQVGLEEAPGVGGRGGHRLRRAGRHDPAALLAALRAEVDHPVRGLDHVHVVLDHQDGVAGVDQALQRGQEHPDVLEVQAGRGLVEDEERVPAVRAGAQVARELQPLGLAAGHGADRLAQPDVAEADVGQGLQRPDHLGLVREEDEGLVDRHVEQVGDRAAAVGHLQDVGAEPAPPAVRAGDVDVREKLHLDPLEPVAAARLAAAAGRVERKVPGSEAAAARLGGVRQQRADRLEGLGVGQGVGARRAADRALVHEHHLVDVRQPLDPGVAPGAPLGVAERAAHGLVEDLLGQGRLAGAGDAREADEAAERDGDVDRLQVVFRRAAHREPAVRPRPAPPGGHRDAAQAAQVVSRERAVHAPGRAEVHHLAAGLARPWARGPGGSRSRG